MSYQVRLSRRTERELERIHGTLRLRLVRAMNDLAQDQRPPDCKKLTGEENGWRIRVGDWRIIYEIHDKELIVMIVRIAHRKDVYR